MGKPLGLLVMGKTSSYYQLIDVLGNTAWHSCLGCMLVTGMLVTEFFNDHFVMEKQMPLLGYATAYLWDGCIISMMKTCMDFSYLVTVTKCL